VAPRKILVVDDDPDIRESLQSIIEANVPQMKVDTASTGQEAVGLLSGQPYAALVTDYRMPGMTGVDLVNAAHSLKPDLAVIMVTAYNSLGMEEAAACAGIDIIVHKPVDPTSFLMALLATLGQHQDPPVG